MPVTSAASAHAFLSAWQDYLLRTYVVFKVEKSPVGSLARHLDVDARDEEVEEAIEGLSSWDATLRHYMPMTQADNVRSFYMHCSLRCLPNPSLNNIFLDNVL